MIAHEAATGGGNTWYFSLLYCCRATSEPRTEIIVVCKYNGVMEDIVYMLQWGLWECSADIYLVQFGRLTSAPVCNVVLVWCSKFCQHGPSPDPLLLWRERTVDSYFAECGQFFHAVWTFCA